METPTIIDIFIGHEREGEYFTLPFRMPAETEEVTLSYRYERDHEEAGTGGFTSRQEVNIIDLGLIAPDGRQVGASGSDKTRIQVSATHATPGYLPGSLTPGEWHILVGAYKVALQGVVVRYELTFTSKHLRLLKGDLHTHTIGSDGILRVEELAQHALQHGLDFLAVTDHNQMASAAALPRLPGLTLIPGVEWTHFRGHATFLGVDKPYDEPFFANTPEEVHAKFNSARERGALITICHPFEEICPFQFDLNALPFDCLEIWNGPMRASNLRAIGLWQSLLAAGKKVPAVGGSDYHRSTLFLFPGGPTTCVYAMSAGPADILSALRQGHGYITFAPDGPTLEMTAGEALPGDSASLSQINTIQIHLEGLLREDVVQLITGQGSTPLLQAGTPGKFTAEYRMEQPGFAYLQVLRPFVPGLPPLPALISNAIYFS